MLQGVKLIAEPWDIGPNGYQLGNFPSPWLEWNDRFRDVMRAFWVRAAGSQVTRGEFAMRFCGSADTFAGKRRLPSASVNFVTAHDGFTLRDVVSYKDKQNYANAEQNRDGHSHNLSRDCGEQGPRIARALLATTLFAQGTPMLCAGDEIGKTQGGNNNAYCQDNEISWLNWDAADPTLLEFVRRVIALRAAEPLLRHEQWFDESFVWCLPNGNTPTDTDWQYPESGGLCALIDQTLLLAFNPHGDAQSLSLASGSWQLLLDSSLELVTQSVYRESASLPAHSLLLFKRMPA